MLWDSCKTPYDPLWKCFDRLTFYAAYHEETVHFPSLWECVYTTWASCLWSLTLFCCGSCKCSFSLWTIFSPSHIRICCTIHWLYKISHCENSYTIHYGPNVRMILHIFMLPFSFLDSLKLWRLPKLYSHPWLPVQWV